MAVIYRMLYSYSTSLVYLGPSGVISHVIVRKTAMERVQVHGKLSQWTCTMQ